VEDLLIELKMLNLKLKIQHISYQKMKVKIFYMEERKVLTQKFGPLLTPPKNM